MPIDNGRDLDTAAHPPACKINPDGTRQHTPMPAAQDIKPGGNFGAPYEEQQ